MSNRIGECFTPSSLWNELRKLKTDRVVLIISRKNPYDIWSVLIVEDK